MAKSATHLGQEQVDGARLDLEAGPHGAGGEEEVGEPVGRRQRSYLPKVVGRRWVG